MTSNSPEGKDETKKT